MRRVEGPRRAPCQLKKPFETETRELLGGTEENSVSLISGSLICPLGKSKIFHKTETEKNE